MVGLSLHSLFLLFETALAVVAVLGVDRADFPADFVFGSGTAAYQYEGAAFEDGRTSSFWDTFAHSGRTNGANGDVACDGYHKYKEDIALMSSMGLEAFRFSISWSRLIPNGRGPVNPMGLQFYNNFINELISHGIQPHVTLHHIDLPQALEDEYGGWLSRRIVKDFAAYADVCFREFGDRVAYWTPVNEANIFALGGYDEGIIPPGRCSTPFSNVCSGGNSSTEPYIVGHNILLAHSATVKLYKKKYKAIQKGYIGFNIYSMWMVPYTNTKEDLIATQRAFDFIIGWFINPLIFGDYPEIVKKNAQGRIPAFTKYESNQIKGSIDFIGVNHYTTYSVKDNPSILETDNRDLEGDMAAQLIYESGEAPPDQYPVMPWSLFGVLEYLKQAYDNPPIFVHENGSLLLPLSITPPQPPSPPPPLHGGTINAELCWFSLLYFRENKLSSKSFAGQKMRRNGTLNDTPRVEYLHAYISGVLDAVRNGSNIEGYFAWTFLDCLELLDGYESGFGLYYVDLDDKELKRYQKLSARWYTDFLKGKSIRSNKIGQLEDGNQSNFLKSRFSQ